MRSTVESDVLQLVFIKRAEGEEVKKINEFQMNFHLITESSLCKYLRGVSFFSGGACRSTRRDLRSGKATQGRQA